MLTSPLAALRRLVPPAPGWRGAGWSSPRWSSPGWPSPRWPSPGWPSPSWPNLGRPRPGWPGRAWRSGTLTALLGAAIALLLVLGAMAPRVTTTFRPEAMFAEGAHGFRVRLEGLAAFPYIAPSSPHSTFIPKDIRLFEEGRELGPAGTAHDEIRAKGLGRFDFWDRDFYFSSSDHTDPRRNGRPYTLLIQTRLHPALPWLGLACAVLLGLRALQAWQRRSDPGAGRLLAAAFAGGALAVLAPFLVSVLTRRMPMLWNDDSFGYANPGVLLAAGEDVTSHLARGIGYPGLIAALLQVAPLTALPHLQLGLLLAGIGLLLAVLYLFLRGSAARLLVDAGRPARALAALGAGLVAALFVLVLLSHDGFVLKFYTVWAEIPHLALTALSLVLFIAAWARPRGQARLLLLVAAAMAAYLSTTAKPHTLLVFALTLIALAGALVADRRSLRAPAVLLALAALGALVVSVQRYEQRVGAASAREFGPKTLFCNHLPLVVPSLDRSTPDRADIAGRLQAIVEAGPDGWTILRHNGDACMYNGSLDPGVSRIAAAEGQDRAGWYRKEFVKAVLRKPLAYLGRSLHQVRAFLARPISDTRFSEVGQMGAYDWDRLKRHEALIGARPEALTATVYNWFARDAGAFSGPAKRLLEGPHPYYAPIVLLATLLAGFRLLLGRARTLPEIALLSTAAFTGASVYLIALSHSFDIGRYTAALVPLTVLWLVLSALYLAETAWRGAWALRPGAWRRAPPPAQPALGWAWNEAPSPGPAPSRQA